MSTKRTERRCHIAMVAQNLTSPFKTRGFANRCPLAAPAQRIVDDRPMIAIMTDWAQPLTEVTEVLQRRQGKQPTVLATLRTLQDAAEFVLEQEPIAKWGEVAQLLQRAAEGQCTASEATDMLRLALFVEGRLQVA